jgi:hypothetical protein
LPHTASLRNRRPGDVVALCHAKARNSDYGNWAARSAKIVLLRIGSFGKGKLAVTIPLIIQIQQAALDSNSSVTDALRKAKLACAKLGLTDFGNWVDLELNGYMNKSSEEVPEYRKLHGTPEAFSPFQGWLPLHFDTAEGQQAWALAVVGMTIPAIEESLRNASGGSFSFPYPPEVQKEICRVLSWGDSPLRIRLGVSQAANILHAVRNILLEWTMEMEKQGVLGNDLLFTPEERAKSTEVTEKTVIHIGQVGAYVHSAEYSTVHGEITSSLDLNGIRQLLQYVEQLLPAANLPAPIKENTETALVELKQAADSATPDGGRVQNALRTLKRVLAPAGEHLLRIGVDAAVTKLLGGG